MDGLILYCCFSSVVSKNIPLYNTSNVLSQNILVVVTCLDVLEYLFNIPHVCGDKFPGGYDMLVLWCEPWLHGGWLFDIGLHQTPSLWGLPSFLDHLRPPLTFPLVWYLEVQSGMSWFCMSFYANKCGPFSGLLVSGSRDSLWCGVVRSIYYWVYILEEAAVALGHLVALINVYVLLPVA